MAKNIRTVERVAEILRCFVDSPSELRVTDIVNRVGLDKGTVSRLLSTLASKQLVSADPITRRYRLGPLMIELGKAGRGHELLAEAALPSLTTLRDVSGETASLNVLSGAARVCVAAVESRFELRRVIETDKPFPPHAGAAGRVLLAFLPKAEADEILNRYELVRLTTHTIINRAELIAAYNDIRRKGYAIGSGERVEGGAGVAVPLFGPGRELVGAIAIAMPAIRFNSRRLNDYVNWCRTAASQIAQRLGRSGPIALDQPALASSGKRQELSRPEPAQGSKRTVARARGS